jgi:catechol 2,3-dioxygenase-like lactoylglutathione lyase family enzyme
VQIGARNLAGGALTAALPRRVETEAAPATQPVATVRAAETARSTQLVRGGSPPLDTAPVARPSSALAHSVTGMPRKFQPAPGKARVLSATDRATAQLAWRYVMANRQSATGLVNGKDSYPVSSVADMAQTVAAYTSALGLQFIEREGFEADMRQLLGTLRELPLYNRELFNREYDSRSGRMLDLSARSSEVGSGWAAEDQGRLLLWLRILALTAPDLAPATEAVFARLRLSRLVAGGQLHSALNLDGREQVISDLRLGRQQVTAAALSVWGVVLPAMFGYDEAVVRRVGALAAPGDRRDGGAVSPDVFARGILELGGIDGCFEAAAGAMLDAQHALARQRRQPIMVADELLDRAPWFVYGALAIGTDEWLVAGFDQLPQPALANFSLKAAHLWAAIDSAAPTQAARALADSLERSDRGMYGGRYVDGRTNQALTLDTTASVLLAAYHAQRGGQPMLRVDNPVDYSCPGLLEVPR